MADLSEAMVDVPVVEHVFDVGVLRLQPGDALVVASERHYSSSVAENIKRIVGAWLAAAGHKDVPVLVASDGLKLGIVRGGDDV